MSLSRRPAWTSPSRQTSTRQSWTPSWPSRSTPSRASPGRCGPISPSNSCCLKGETAVGDHLGVKAEPQVQTNQKCFCCRSLAPSAVKKRKITQQIMSIALEHQFVTPLTTLLVESQDATERLLADSPKDPKHGCCSGGIYHVGVGEIKKVLLLQMFMVVGLGLGGGSSAAGPTPVRVVYQPPPWVQMTTPAPPSQAEKGPEEWTLPKRVTIGNVHIKTTPSCSFLFLNVTFLLQWITTLTSSSTYPEATWTSASTSTPNRATSSTWFLTAEQVQGSFSTFPHIRGAVNTPLLKVWPLTVS